MRLREWYLDAASGLAALVTWLLVAGVPIELGVAIQRGRPDWPAFVPWACGTAAFGLCLALAEPFWRGLRCLLSAGHAGVPRRRSKTAEERAAGLIALALGSRDARWSWMKRRWPAGTEHTLVHEAYAILAACVDASHDGFDQAKLDRELQRLNEIMNRLRAH